MSYTVVIGLEVHVQLQTRSKLFCGCANLFNPDNPNVQTCPVCLGLPGSLPVLNREAFRLAVKTGIALDCDIATFTKWDRKQYFYPDLPKAYQISQFDLPFSADGFLDIAGEEITREEKDDDDQKEKTAARRIRIIRAHLEEDAGKNLHDESGRGGESRVDLNRCGTPLVEIVSHPDLRSAVEARQYLEELRLLLRYIDVSDCNMQEGSLRCDANVNLHLENDAGETVATPIVEVKNLNSFRGVEAAIDYEVARQYQQWQETGQLIGDVPKQTRGWNADRGTTFAQRGKEEAADYRYFPDPDLTPITIDADWLQTVREELCELPAVRRERFQTDYGLSKYDASVLIEHGSDTADYFEETVRGSGDGSSSNGGSRNGKLAANWVTQDLLRELNDRQMAIAEFPVTSELLAELLRQIAEKKVTIQSARKIFAQLLSEADQHAILSVDRIGEIIVEEKLEIVSDTGALETVIAAVLAKNEAMAADVRGGKLAAVGPLIGQVMRDLKGADPKTVREILLQKIQG